jgi:hypothetical protein
MLKKGFSLFSRIATICVLALVFVVNFGVVANTTFPHLKKNTPIDSKDACLSKANNENTLLVKSVWFGSEKENNNLNLPVFEKEEDDESNSSKRNFKSSNYSSSVFFAPVNGCFFSSNEKTLPFFNYFSYYPSNRYLIFQVFRI